jgi:hypothetical protein
MIHNDQSERPWEEPGNVRRDCEPHRGKGLLLLGTIARVWALLSLISCLPGLIAFPLGLIVHSMSERDIRRMHAGLMDPQGRPQTLAACSAAVQGVAGSIAGAVIWMCVVPALLRFLF